TPPASPLYSGRPPRRAMHSTISAPYSTRHDSGYARSNQPYTPGLDTDARPPGRAVDRRRPLTPASAPAASAAPPPPDAPFDASPPPPLHGRASSTHTFAAAHQPLPARRHAPRSNPASAVA